ncbi:MULTISPECIES: MarR family winged helix-turn-helix transcriptional regulator [Microbacterium]|uniref:MarR family winged helix-turn-helix transcriptional regulator n=1 Tax=Microbacterium profundi TaxID=450380 RepID=A0ABV3LDY4_9MICO|nr:MULTISPECIES: MarR family winged helix-turn-helix transcriptional regulator [Microbacterium]MCE7482165.1 MarR family winged helix-turn-helix transcriptional regulator [Microbacterium profundi]
MTVPDLPEPQRHVGNLIRRAQQLHLSTWARVADPDITSTQYSILTILDRLGEASQRELGDEADLDRSTIADLVRRMEKSGLIARQRAAGDARRNVVTLTEHGAGERKRLAPLVVDVQRELTAHLEADEVAALFRGLWRMLER